MDCAHFGPKIYQYKGLKTFCFQKKISPNIESSKLEYDKLSLFVYVFVVQRNTMFRGKIIADIDTKINQRNREQRNFPDKRCAETKSNLDIVNTAAINLPISFENIRSPPFRNWVSSLIKGRNRLIESYIWRVYLTLRQSCRP